jgi:hypothetical protein
VWVNGQGTPAHNPGEGVLTADGPKVIPPSPSYRFPNGQTYYYNVEWHMFNAGTAVVKMQMENGRQHITSTGESAGVVNALYKVHDRFEAYSDPKTFCSLEVLKHTEEGSRRKEVSIHMDYARKKSILDEKNLKTGEQKHEENDIPGCVTDLVTGFHYLASLPLENGTVHDFPISDGGKDAVVRARVAAREKIKVPAGTFDTIRVEAEALTGNLQGRGNVAVWLTDDANRTPVQMRSKLTWGTLMFRMQKLEK